MKTGPMAFVRLGQERARVYFEGGISFEHYIRNIGWVADNGPNPALAKIAIAVRNAHCPHLQPLGADAMDD